MMNHPDLPELEIVPTQSLRPHEKVEAARVDPLIGALERDGLLRNPPIVYPLKAGDDYVILDGANRAMAFRRMGIPHVLVQVVQPDLHEVAVKSWNHAIRGAHANGLVEGFGKIPGTTLVEGHALDPKHKPALRLLLPSGEHYSLFTETESLEDKVRVLNQAAGVYLPRYRIERTISTGPIELQEVYPDLVALAAYPSVTLQQVRRMAQEGLTFPTGVTRFLVSPRTLHVNYPLAYLRAASSLSEKRDELKKWMRARARERGIRFYAESTFLFDE